MPPELLIVLFFCSSTSAFPYREAAHTAPARAGARFRSWYEVHLREGGNEQSPFPGSGCVHPKGELFVPPAADEGSFRWCFSALKLPGQAGGPVQGMQQGRGDAEPSRLCLHRGSLAAASLPLRGCSLEHKAVAHKTLSAFPSWTDLAPCPVLGQ